MKTLGKSILIKSFLSIVIFCSCESHEQKADDAFENFKEDKMNIKDTIIIEKMISKPEIQAAKIEKISEFEKFKKEIEKKIISNENKIKLIKLTPQSNSKLFKRVLSLENDNKNLKIKFDLYQEELKKNFETFKNKLNLDVNEIESELTTLSKEK
jgi:hypothetical protein